MYVVNRYVRAEVLAGFVNGLFLLFIGFFIFSEAIEVKVLNLFQVRLLYMVLRPKFSVQYTYYLFFFHIFMLNEKKYGKGD